MATYVPPKRATAYITYIGLVSQADVKLLQVNPTLAAGDVKVSIDGAAFNNITTLPVVTPAGGRAVKVSLSALEMTGDTIDVVFSDAAGAEWCDLFLTLQTSAKQIDDLAAPVTIKKNVALANFMFQMTDSSTHQPKTGLVNGDFTKKESLDGATGASLSGTITEVDATNLPGIYKIDLSAAETNATTLAFRFAASGCDDLEFSCVTNT